MAWEEIQGSRTPGEHQRFVEYIEGLTRSGIAREVPVDPNLRPRRGLRGSMVSRRRIWGGVALDPPDPPFTGLWERVKMGDA